MEHLSLEIFDLTGTGSKYAYLPDDTSITVTDTSDIFASGDVYSHPFTLNIRSNAHIFGTSGDMHGSRLHEQINGRRARLWVERIPMYLGSLKLGDEADVDENGNIDVTLESGQKTFEDMIEGAKANQVPMMDDVLIGMALWRKRWTSCKFRLKAAATFSDGTTSTWEGVRDSVERQGQERDKIAFAVDGEDDYSAVQAYPRMVFPQLQEGVFTSEDEGALTSVDCVNTDSPYTEDANGTPTHPYCSVPLCYQKYDYKQTDKDGNVTTDYTSEPEAQRGYDYMPANRLNSAPNFFVIYWIRALMKHLGIYVEENQMMDVEDLRRLFFVNTNCAYREPKYMRLGEPGDGMHRYSFTWDGRKSNRPIAEHYGKLEGEDETGQYERWGLVNPDECVLKCTFNAGEPSYTGQIDPASLPTIEKVSVEVEHVHWWEAEERRIYERTNGFLHEAYATSDCFPDTDISEVIKAIESGFGVRLVFSNDYRRVRIVLLRNVFRSTDVQQPACDVVSESKQEGAIRGFRMTYGKTGDTQFYYKGFADKLPHKKEMWVDDSDTHDYSHWDLEAVYGELINRISAFDKTCYVTPTTGNAYGIKVDKDAKRYDELRPSLFEYAGFMDAEDGDCTGEEETIETVSLGFKPAIMNDLNMEEERKGDLKQRFALFVSEEMRPRRVALAEGSDYNAAGTPYPVYGKDGLYGEDSPAKNMVGDNGVIKPGEFAILSDIYAEHDQLETTITKEVASADDTYGHTVVSWPVSLKISGSINEGYRLYLQDNYKPDDDVCPIETHDWGLTLGIMRGSGSDAAVEYMPDKDDSEGNDTWEIVPGSGVTSHPDTCDCYGNIFDYTADGQEDKQDMTGRFSLKLRAEKLNPYFDPTKPDDTRVVMTKDEAGEAMTQLFTTADCDLLDRSRVPLSLLRSKGWDVPGDGYATVYGQTYSVKLADGRTHDMLFTPITANNVLTPLQMSTYAGTFNGISASAIKSKDSRNLVLDVDTTENRAQLLHELQALYYAEDGETADAVVIFGENSRYLEIARKDLRGRGLADKFYREYSYWVRNARVANMEVKMGITQLTGIDKTKRVRIGDITGFVRKMQYSVGKKTGMGNVTMEIMYI